MHKNHKDSPDIRHSEQTTTATTSTPSDTVTLATTRNQVHIRDSSGRFTKKPPFVLDPTSYATSSLTPVPSRITGSPSAPNTRPPSSLSNFELLDLTRTPTPFDTTPPTSPVSTNQKTSVNNLHAEKLPHEDKLNMPTDQVEPFHGDREDENPEDFLRSFFRHMGTSSDEVKKQQFRYFLQADSAADEWFDDLQQTEKKDWNAIEEAFNKRWPRKKAAKKTTEEYEEEITGLRLKIEDLGKKEKMAGREVYSHIAWADKMMTIVKGAKIEATTTYIGHVRRELPKLLREKVGTGHTDWTAFLQAVRDVDVDHIRDGVDIWKREQDEQEAIRKRIQQLEKLTASPTAPLRQQMTTFSIANPTPSPIVQQPQQAVQAPTNPFVGNTGGRRNLFQTPQTGNPPQNNTQRPQATQADRAALLVCLQKYPHHPDTEAGRQAHRAQQTDWVRTHGQGAFVTESTPYPLQPGTLPVGSGECFTCGLSGHMGKKDGSTCGGNRALHPHEQTWRAICSRIFRQTRNIANVQLVTVDDYGTSWQEVQGNEDGPSD